MKDFPAAVCALTEVSQWAMVEPMETVIGLAKKIKLLAASKLGLRTNDAIERRLGWYRGLLGKWESGKVEPKFLQIAVFSRLVGVSLDFLADDKAQKPDESEFTREERYLVQRLRDSGITATEALEKVLMAPRDPGQKHTAMPVEALFLGSESIPDDTPRKQRHGGRGGKAQKDDPPPVIE